MSGPRPGRNRAARWAGAALTIALLGGPPTVDLARAHAVLVRSAPSHRAVLGQAPERVDLWFNERLEPAYSTVSIWNESGSQVDERDATVAGHR